MLEQKYKVTNPSPTTVRSNQILWSIAVKQYVLKAYDMRNPAVLVIPFSPNHDEILLQFWKESLINIE